MTDLIDMLRMADDENWPDLCMEAADEIEAQAKKIERLKAEIETLTLLKRQPS